MKTNILASILLIDLLRWAYLSEKKRHFFHWLGKFCSRSRIYSAKNLTKPGGKKVFLLPNLSTAISLIFIFTFLAMSCTKYILPDTNFDLSNKSSINNGSTGSSTINSIDDGEYFRLLRKAELQLRRLIEIYKIKEPRSNPESVNASDPKVIIFTHIDAIGNEIAQLRNNISNLQAQSRPKPVPTVRNNNKEEKLQLEIDTLNSIVADKNQEVLRLNSEINKLIAQIATMEAAQAPPPPPPVNHFCKVKLKKNNTVLKDILVKGQTISFNFKFDLDDIKTSHPGGSFHLEGNKDITIIIIKDPDQFWSKSNELIVFGKKKHHACIDRDLRKN